MADFIVHMTISAHLRGIQMRHFYRENTLRLTLGDEVLCPDSAFELVATDGRQFNFLVELDNGTERIRSDKDTDSWTRKIHLYQMLQDGNFPYRFRVLVVTTRSQDRYRSILALAAELATNPNRSLFYATHLADFLDQPDAIVHATFRNHRDDAVSLIPEAVADSRPIASSSTVPLW